MWEGLPPEAWSQELGDDKDPAGEEGRAVRGL